MGLYHRLPWTDEDVYNDERHSFNPVAKMPLLEIVHAKGPPHSADISKGNLGRKSGQGFYAWSKGQALKDPIRSAVPLSDNDISDRLILRLINESVACLREGVVEDEDLLDAGVIFGTGFALFRGGPMHYIHSCETGELQQRLDELEGRFGQHFHADSGWGAIA